jgi:hypothetical protein
VKGVGREWSRPEHLQRVWLLWNQSSLCHHEGTAKQNKLLVDLKEYFIMRRKVGVAKVTALELNYELPTPHQYFMIARYETVMGQPNIEVKFSPTKIYRQIR